MTATITTREEKLNELYEVLVSVYRLRNHDLPEVSAQFNLDLFMSRHRDDPYLDDVLQMEIEDCRRPLTSPR